MPQLIEPMRKGDAFIEDVLQHRGKPGFRLWWLGQSGYLLQHGHRHALLDPYLSDSLTEKYADTDKPHIRMTELIVDPARLDFIDVATSSHNHTDHLDAATLKPLMRANPSMRILVPEANRDFAADRLGVDPASLLTVDAGNAVEAAGFTFHAVPAAHDELETDDHGRHKFLGYVVTFGSFAVYHSGDTRLYDGLTDRLRRFDIDIAILPINGRRPERRVAGNLWGREAAQLASDIGAKLVTPCHYEMFTFNTEPPDEFIETCRKLDQPHRVLRCGNRIDWPAE